MNKPTYVKVTIKNKGYGEFDGTVFRVDKNLPKNDFDYLTSPRGRRGFRFGKHLCEMLKKQFGKNFTIFLTVEPSKIIKKGNNNIIYVNYEEHQKIANNEYIYIRRDAGLAASSKFLSSNLGFKLPISRAITRSQAEELIDNIPQAVAKAAKKVKDHFAEQVVRTLEQTDFKSDDIEDISAAGKQRYYKNELKKLEDKIKENFKKKNIKKSWENPFYKPWFRRNYWIFGTEYKRKLTRSRISIDKLVDLRLETVDGYEEIIEIKPPNVEVLKYDSSHKTFYPTEDLAKAITQSTYYIYEMELDELKLNLKAEEEGESSRVLKPRAKIVIGHARIWRGLSKREKEKRRKALRLLNDSLVNLRVYLYDEIVNIGNTMIQKYKERLK